MNETMIIIGVLTVIAIIVLEASLESTWSRTLFTRGLVIYSKEYNFRKIPPIEELNAQNRSKWFQPIIFHEFSSSEIGFRESMLSASFLVYTPIMRGFIFIKYNDQILQIKGIVNYSSLIVALVFIFFATLGLYHGSYFIMLSIPFILFTVGILYLIQLNRFDQIGEFISRFE